MSRLYYLDQVGYFTKDQYGHFVNKGRQMTKEQIENVFTYHKPKDSQPARYEILRETAKSFAFLI